MTVGPGSSKRVVSERLVSHYLTAPSFGSQGGVLHVAASGTAMANRGEKTVLVRGSETHRHMLKMRMSDFQKFSFLVSPSEQEMAWERRRRMRFRGAGYSVDIEEDLGASMRPQAMQWVCAETAPMQARARRRKSPPSPGASLAQQRADARMGEGRIKQVGRRGGSEHGRKTLPLRDPGMSAQQPAGG